jgi:hypothetical protein
VSKENSIFARVLGGGPLDGAEMDLETDCPNARVRVERNCGPGHYLYQAAQLRWNGEVAGYVWMYTGEFACEEDEPTSREEDEP